MIFQCPKCGSANMEWYTIHAIYKDRAAVTTANKSMTSVVEEKWPNEEGKDLLRLKFDCRNCGNSPVIEFTYGENGLEGKWHKERKYEL